MSPIRNPSWSDLTIREIENHILWLQTRIPGLQSKHFGFRASPGSERGSDITISMTDHDGMQHFLLFEVEQYASGSGLKAKVKAWAGRHFDRPDTTTVVISLVLQALRNRLTGEFSKDSMIRQMVYSADFRLFPGSGDGKVTDELRSFLTMWVEQRL